MDRHFITQQKRIEARKARSRKARRWVRWTQLALTCAIATAIWQERALAPQAHDRMQLAVAVAGDWIEQSENAKSYLTAMSDFAGNAGESDFGPITEALLEMRQ